MKKKLKKPSIKTVNHRDGGMSFYAEGGEFDFLRNQTPNVPTNFEQRMYHTPHIDNEDGSMSSHKMMSWSDENGEHSAPTIVYQNGQLVELTPEEAIDYAYKTGEMKTFNTFQENLDYGNNGYKTGTPMELFLQNPEFEPNALYGGRNNYAAGGTINPSWPKPTATDSLNLYNNAVKVLDYYRKTNNYSEFPPIYTNESLFDILKYGKNKFDKNNKSKNITYPNKNGYSKTGSIPPLMYYEKLSPYKFKQREDANAVLDTRAPMSLYDLRINPSASYSFSNENQKDSMHGDQVDISGYDPIAIKPYKLLTPAERKLREKRYGKPISNITKTPKSIISKVVEETTGPKVVREIPSPLNPNYKPKENFMLKSYSDMVNGTLQEEPIVELNPVEINASVQNKNSGKQYTFYMGDNVYKTTDSSKAKQFSNYLGVETDENGNAYTYDKLTGKNRTWITGSDGKLYPNQQAYQSGEYKNAYDATKVFGMTRMENGGIIDKYATGGPIKPTWSRPTFNDSLNLYNNALSVDNFYKNNDYVVREEEYKIKEPWKFLEEVRNDFKKYPNRHYSFNDYYKKINDHQFNQRELQAGHLNLDAPMPLYDRRINPTARINYQTKGFVDLQKKYNAIDPKTGRLRKGMSIKDRIALFKETDELLLNSKNGVDGVDVFLYDPVAIKPYSLLTPEEKSLREERYGSSNNSKVFTKTPSPVNPAYKPRTTGIPFLLSDEVVNTTTPMTPSVPVAPTTTTSKTPMTANPTKWFSLDGSGNKVLIDNQYLTRDEFEKFKVANPNFNYSQKPDSVGRKYNMGGGIELSNRMYEEGGEYELSDQEIQDLRNQGYDIELL